MKFDDAEDEEESEIDTEDLGLLDHNGDDAAVEPLKPLTRKSIKPTRLFQSEEQKRTREAEKEEEALTDIEEQASTDVAQLVSPSTPAKKTEKSATPPPTGRALRSATKKEFVDVNEGLASALEHNKAKKPKRSSPFDSWKRVKAGSAAVAVEPTKSRKRGSDVLDEETATSSKKSKAG